MGKSEHGCGGLGEASLTAFAPFVSVLWILHHGENRVGDLV
jgi:hypothetical protein